MNYTARRRAQGKQTEQAILSAALRLMRERGYEQVSVREVCKEAGITTGAFYHHFPSKQALLGKGFGTMDRHMERHLQGVGAEPPALRLWRILEGYARFMEGAGALTAQYYQKRMGGPPGRSTIDPNRYTIRVMVDCFRQAEAEGILKAGRSPEWLAEFCYRHFRGVAIDWILSGYAYSLRDAVREDYALFESLFSGEPDGKRA